MIQLLRKEKETKPLAYNNRLLDDRDFQMFLGKYAAALGAGKLDWTMKDNEGRLKVAQDAWETLT